MAELLGRPLSDGSYWAINLNITTNNKTISPSDKGLFKMNLRFNRTRMVVFQDQHGNPRHSEEFQLLSTTVPTLHLPGTTHYYTALHQWLQSLHGRLPLEGNVVNDLTDRVIERVSSLDQKLAICVGADLHRVSLEFEPCEAIPMEFRQDGDETENEDEEEGLMDYVEELNDLYGVVAVIAAEEQYCRFGDCSICLEHLGPVGEEEEEEEGGYYMYVFGSPCGHFFHKKCMVKWLRLSDSCPLCRYDI